MWPTIISSLLGNITGPLSAYFKTKAETAQAKATAALELQKAQIEFNKQQGIDSVESEKNKLAATSQGFKLVSFILLNIPIIITCLSKTRGSDLWGNLTLIPVWYAQMYAAVVFVIWGLPIAAGASSTVFAAIQQAWESRQDKKIQKIQAIGEANGLNTAQAKKEILDTMKKVVGLQGYSQTQVDAIVPVLDKYLDSKGS